MLSEGPTKRGNKVTVCTMGHERLPNFKVESGVKMFRFRGFFQRIPFPFKDSERKFHPPIRDWMIIKKLKKIIEKEKPDIMHAHGWILYSVDVVRINKYYDNGYVKIIKIAQDSLNFRLRSNERSF